MINEETKSLFQIEIVDQKPPQIFKHFQCNEQEVFNAEMIFKALIALGIDKRKEIVTTGWENGLRNVVMFVKKADQFVHRVIFDFPVSSDKLFKVVHLFEDGTMRILYPSDIDESDLLFSCLNVISDEARNKLIETHFFWENEVFGDESEPNIQQFHVMCWKTKVI